MFCNRKRDVAILQGSLKKHGFNAGALHGDMSQPARMETLEKFKQGEIQILVASDVAARGLDIVDMSHVFNFDVPFSPEDYVHRIGRTGRAGKTGHSFTLASPDEGALVEAIEKLIGSAIPRVEVPGMDALAFEQAEGRKRRGRGRGAKAAGGSERGRAPRKAPRDEQPAERQAETPIAQEARRSRSPRDRRSERDLQREPRAERSSRSHDRRPERRRERDDRAPVGLGDHVPAFLARPAR